MYSSSSRSSCREWSFHSCYFANSICLCEGGGLCFLWVTNQSVGWRSRYSDWLRAGRSGDRIPVGTRFSAPVHTGPGSRPASCAMDTGSFAGVKSGRGMTLTLHLLLGPWSWKGRVNPLLPLWAIRPVQSLNACTMVHCTFTFTFSVFEWSINYTLTLS